MRSTTEGLPPVPAPRASRAVTGFSGYVPGQQEALEMTQGRVLKTAAQKRVIPVIHPRFTAGSFLSSASTDGAIYNHGFETTSGQMSRAVTALAQSRGSAERPPGAGELPRAATGYTGHVHQYGDIIGKSFHEALRLGDLRVDAAAATRIPPSDFEKHWTDFYGARDQPDVVQSGGWRSVFGLATARRAPPSALNVHNPDAPQSLRSGLTYHQTLYKGAVEGGFEQQSRELNSQTQVPSFASGFKTAVGAPAGDPNGWSPAAETAWSRGFVTQPLEEEIRGPFTEPPRGGIAGYSGHVPAAIDSLGKTHARVQTALAVAKDRGYREPPHPLGRSFMR